jgi:hypothetical protein
VHTTNDLVVKATRHSTSVASNHDYKIFIIVILIITIIIIIIIIREMVKKKTHMNLLFVFQTLDNGYTVLREYNNFRRYMYIHMYT